jgi:hypothetical protein
MPLTDGQTFAGYTIIRLLGSGGMGEVYLAQHPRLPRRDALKLLPHEWSADDEYPDGDLVTSATATSQTVESEIDSADGGDPRLIQ